MRIPHIQLRILGETKLAIHSLYERVMMIPWLAVPGNDTKTTNGQGGTSNGTGNGNNVHVTTNNIGSVEVMDSKLYTIRERLIDLRNLVEKAQQLMNGKAPRKG